MFRFLKRRAQAFFQRLTFIGFQTLFRNLHQFGNNQVNPVLLNLSAVFDNGVAIGFHRFVDLPLRQPGFSDPKSPFGHIGLHTVAVQVGSHQIQYFLIAVFQLKHGGKLEYRIGGLPRLAGFFDGQFIIALRFVEQGQRGAKVAAHAERIAIDC